jgi:acetyl-CoA carboxylase carboxyl transferase subunit beta
MMNKDLFKKPHNDVESYQTDVNFIPSVPDDLYTSCPSCKRLFLSNDIKTNIHTCPKCGYNFGISARDRIEVISDPETFKEMFPELESDNVLNFPDYETKISCAKEKSSEKEAVICGTARIGGNLTAMFSMERNFMMGSMGRVVGEKITRIFEYATEKSLPVLGFTVSGGARMQEGILSLMQMAKVSGAVKSHSLAGNLYIAVLTDPTTGGVTASFAMQADIILAEPGALIGFAGPKVIQDTIRQKLPAGFQRAEFLLEKGFIDEIVPRSKQREYIARLLSFHSKEVRHAGIR